MHLLELGSGYSCFGKPITAPKAPIGVSHSTLLEWGGCMTGIFSADSLTILAPVPRQDVARRYAIAIAAAMVAILLRWLLDPVLGHVAFYVTLYVTVTFCAVVCGF